MFKSIPSKQMVIARESAYHLTGLIGGDPAEASTRRTADTPVDPQCALIRMGGDAVTAAHMPVGYKEATTPQWGISGSVQS